MTWEYKEAVEWLEAKDVFRTRLGLDRMRGLLDEMDMSDPTVTAHLAGTNGKGSISAFLASILHEGGYKTGLYTSPHLCDIRERFSSGEGMISKEHFTRGMEAVRLADEKADESSYFEVLTALFFWWAREQKFDHIIMETGLGGRLDATNVVTPNVSIITPISLEHTQHLGSTVEEIAAEKAAIIKDGRPTVVSPLDPKARQVVEERCEHMLSPLIRADRGVDTRVITPVEKRGNKWGQMIEIVTTLGDYGEVFIPLLGSHQRMNAVTAIRAAEVLRRQGVDITDQQIRKGIQETSWPARIEFFEKPMPLVLDVTHNPSGARILANELMRIMTTLELDSVVIVLGMMADKDVDSVLVELTRLRGTMVCTSPKIPRAMPASELTAKAREIGGTGLGVLTEPNVASAIDKAMKQGDLVCVTGSFYTVEEAMDHLNIKPSVLRG